MKSKFIIAALVMMLPFFADAQLKGLMNKVKNKVDQRIDHKVDKQIDKSLDEVEGKMIRTLRAMETRRQIQQLKPKPKSLH
jgi:DNA integrity scanning protein DisA with diadenylate cyclase activity